ERHCWKVNRDDQFVRCQICVPLGCVTRQTMKVTESNLSFTIWAVNAHHRVEGGQRDTHVARVGRDALLALAENRVATIVTLKCGTAAAGFAFVACCERRIVKIITTRPLQKIAAHGSILRNCGLAPESSAWLKTG